MIPEHITAIANNCDYLEEINLGEVTHLNDECISTQLSVYGVATEIEVKEPSAISPSLFLGY